MKYLPMHACRSTMSSPKGLQPITFEYILKSYSSAIICAPTTTTVSSYMWCDVSGMLGRAHELHMQSTSGGHTRTYDIHIQIAWLLTVYIVTDSVAVDCLCSLHLPK